MAEVSSQYQK